MENLKLKIMLLTVQEAKKRITNLEIRRQSWRKETHEQRTRITQTNFEEGTKLGKEDTTVMRENIEKWV